jgi:hypothetical protein
LDLREPNTLLVPGVPRRASGFRSAVTRRLLGAKGRVYDGFDYSAVVVTKSMISHLHDERFVIYRGVARRLTGASDMWRRPPLDDIVFHTYEPNDFFVEPRKYRVKMLIVSSFLNFFRFLKSIRFL